MKKPVHSDTHVRSREDSSLGGAMSGSHDAPVVAMTLLSADILLPKRQAGHAKSLIVSGENLEISPQADLSRHLQFQNPYADQKQVVPTSRSHLMRG